MSPTMVCHTIRGLESGTIWQKSCEKTKATTFIANGCRRQDHKRGAWLSSPMSSLTNCLEFPLITEPEATSFATPFFTPSNTCWSTLGGRILSISATSLLPTQLMRILAAVCPTNRLVSPLISCPDAIGQYVEPRQRSLVQSCGRIRGLLPTPQFDPFEHLDAPWISPKDMAELSDAWDVHAEKVEEWTKGILLE